MRGGVTGFGLVVDGFCGQEVKGSHVAEKIFLVRRVRARQIAELRIEIPVILSELGRVLVLDCENFFGGVFKAKFRETELVS